MIVTRHIWDFLDSGPAGGIFSADRSQKSLCYDKPNDKSLSPPVSGAVMKNTIRWAIGKIPISAVFFTYADYGNSDFANLYFLLFVKYNSADRTSDYDVCAAAPVGAALRKGFCS